MKYRLFVVVFFFQAEDGIRDIGVTGVQTCALPIYRSDGKPIKKIPSLKRDLDARAQSEFYRYCEVTF